MNRWPSILLTAGGAIAFGLGVASLLPPLMHEFAIWTVVPLMAVGGYLLFDRQDAAGRFTLPVILAGIALIVVLGIGLGAMSHTADLNPNGQWDAWSIWNLRAKFLASPDPARAWSPLLTETHPEYPLLVSGAVAATGAPLAVGYLFFAALIATVTGGIAIARGSLAGLVAGLTLATTGALLHEVPSQYAEVPLAAYLACSVIFVLIDRPIWAGAFAGFAAWTKDEGALFCVALVAALAIFRRKDLLRTAIGMLPGALLFLGFRLFLAPHVTAQFGAGTLSRFADLHRWSVVLSGVATQSASLGAGWFHPVFIIAALAIGVRVRTDSRRDAYFSTALALAILAGYCGAMVTSSSDVVWQTNTAAGRLVVQWWPLAVIAMITWLRPAEEWIVSAVPGRKGKSK